MSDYAFLIDPVPHYLPQDSDPGRHIHAFAYTITVTNTGAVAAQLISRYWKIQDDNGHIEEVNGLGVVGQQPLLQPGESFRYTSGCRLRTAGGTMLGHYFFVAEDGHRFEVEIPMFYLQAADPEPRSHTLH